VATFGRTVIYIEWGRQETQALWRGGTFWSKVTWKLEEENIIKMDLGKH